MKFFTKKNLIFGAMLLALAVIVSLITAIEMPITGAGYLSGSSIIIYYAAIFLSPIFGGIVGAVSALITALVVAPSYAPIAIVASGLEGIVCGLVFMYIRSERARIKKIVAMLVAGLNMSAVYFVVELFVSGIDVAGINFGFHMLQSVVGVIIILLVFPKLTTIREEN